jgi:hypothetical protein
MTSSKSWNANATIETTTHAFLTKQETTSTSFSGFLYSERESLDFKTDSKKSQMTILKANQRRFYYFN